MAVKSIDLRKIEENVSNVYEAVIVSAKRARRINDENKLEFNTQLNTMIPGIEDEFDDKENSDQVKISVEFETKTKPHLRALEELLSDEIRFRYKEKETL